MLRGRRRNIIKAAGLAALILGAYVLFSLLTQQSASLENEAAYRSDIHRENADYRIVWVCKTAPSQETCISESRQAARENEREEQDLAAQKITAWWTKVMGIAALIGMGLSAVGVWLVKTTFDETKESNRIARQAAKSSADDARKSREAMIAAERAIVFVTHGRQDGSVDSEGQWTGIYFGIDNKGKSNAYGFQARFRISDHAKFTGTYRFSHNIEKICPPGETIITKTVKIRTPKRYPAFIIGHISYSTNGADGFNSFFCFRIDGPVIQDAYGTMTNTVLQSVDCQDLLANT
jgi:hypothetical protein